MAAKNEGLWLSRTLKVMTNAGLEQFKLGSNKVLVTITDMASTIMLLLFYLATQILIHIRNDPCHRYYDDAKEGLKDVGVWCSLEFFKK